MSFIYLDYNATTPIDPEVLALMSGILEEAYGNPSSPHAQGLRSCRAVDRARQQVADFLGCSPEEVVFTSGGSESNNLALKGAAHALRDRGRHLITTAIEHPAVLEVCGFLEREGWRVTRVPVDHQGRVDPDQVEKAVEADTVLISVMHANNEVGTIQPIQEISAIAWKKKILLHVDAAQSAGKIPVNVANLGVDLLSLAGHKLYAPKGVGVLFVRKGVALTPLIHGAGHEWGKRAGTENVAGVAALGRACELAGQDLREEGPRLTELRDRLHDILKKEIPDLHLNGHPSLRLPNTLSVSFPGLLAPDLIAALKDLALSAGAACHADGVQASHVLEAMKIPLEVSLGTLRISTGRFSSITEIDQAAARILEAVRMLKS